MGDVWSPLLLFLFVIGGPMALLSCHGSRRGRASARFLIGLSGAVNGDGVRQSLCRRRATAAAVFTVPDRRAVLRPLLTITQTPQQTLTEFFLSLGVGPYGVLALILAMYIVLGCLMDALAMDHPHGADRVSGDSGARLRSDLVRLIIVMTVELA